MYFSLYRKLAGWFALRVSLFHSWLLWFALVFGCQPRLFSVPCISANVDRVNQRKNSVWSGLEVRVSVKTAEIIRGTNFPFIGVVSVASSSHVREVKDLSLRLVCQEMMYLVSMTIMALPSKEQSTARSHTSLASKQVRLSNMYLLYSGR